MAKEKLEKTNAMRILDQKKVAYKEHTLGITDAVSGVEAASLLGVDDLLALTGYVHGGCSPIGMKKFFKTTIDQSALDVDRIFFSGGRIGFQIETTLDELKKAIVFQLKDVAVR